MVDQDKPKAVRVRFAPSPTGEVHLGSARTALFDYLFARHHNGTHILRIEDTDQARYVEGAMDRFFADLAWLGIEFDEGPQVGGDYGSYISSERTELYQKAAQELLDKGHAYRCWCTPERLTEMREAQMAAKQPPRYDRRCLTMKQEERMRNQALRLAYVVRMKVPAGETVFTDLVRGEVRVNNKEVDDQILLKSDGFPTYHLAAIVDDHVMKISHVLRSEEWLPSTPKHLLLYQMFGWQIPEFAHLPVILNKERRKLSKRTDGEAVWIATYRKEGYLPEAVVNYLAFMGWNPGDEREFFTMDELIKEFSMKRVHAAGAIFDSEKLKFVNAHYLRQLDDETIVQKLRDGDFLSTELSTHDNRWLAKWVRISRDRMQILSEFETIVGPIFNLSEYPTERLLFKKSDRERTMRGLRTVLVRLQHVPEPTWDSIEELQTVLTKAVSEAGLTNGDVFWPVRVALSGLEASPSPAELLWALGQSTSLARIKEALSRLESTESANQ